MVDNRCRPLYDLLDLFLIIYIIFIGRTGTCVAAWLLFSGQFKTAEVSFEHPVYNGSLMSIYIIYDYLYMHIYAYIYIYIYIYIYTHTKVQNLFKNELVKSKM